MTRTRAVPDENEMAAAGLHPTTASENIETANTVAPDSPHCKASEPPHPDTQDTNDVAQGLICEVFSIPRRQASVVVIYQNELPVDFQIWRWRLKRHAWRRSLRDAKARGRS